MSNIRVDLDYTIRDGLEIKFRSPVDCSAITGLIVYYPGLDGEITSTVFSLADAHGNNVGDIDHLFAENVVVKVILDVTTGMAFVQNADTNAYLEAQLAGKAPAGYGLGGQAKYVGDLNTATESGFYYFDAALNAPFAYGTLIVTKRIDNVLSQIAIGTSGGGKGYIATRVNDLGWANWSFVQDSKLLWQNASPSSSMATQTISFSSHSYPFYRVLFGDTTGAIQGDITFPVGSGCHVSLNSGTEGQNLGQAIVCSRIVRSSTNTSITITDCTYANVFIDNWSGFNGFLFPLYIYGVGGLNR